MKRNLFAVIVLLFPAFIMAQTLKNPTLDELMWGGNKYWTLQPEHISTAWWGESLVRTGVDTCSLMADSRGRAVASSKAFLFNRDEVNAVLRAASPEDTLRTLQYAAFKGGKQMVVRLESDKNLFEYDWKRRQITWMQPALRGTSYREFCAASHSTAYIKDYNLYVRTADGKDLQVTTDGSRDLLYGTSVHRNEFGIEKGTFWSPKGRFLAFYRMDQSMVTDFPLVDIEVDSTTQIAQLAPEKYPMAGMTSHKVTVGVFDPATGKTVYLDAGDPTDRYFTNVSWSPDERYIFLMELPRSQDKCELVAYSAQTGERVGVFYTETNARFVEPQHPLSFIPWDASRFIYQSERDGFNHLYVFHMEETDGKLRISEERQLTSGAYEDLELLGFNTATRSLILVTNESGHIRENVYSVDFNTGRRTLLDNGVGVHRANLSPAGTLYTDRWSKPDVFRRMELRATARPQLMQTLQECESPWREYSMPEVKGGTLTAADGKTPLYYRLVLPVGFDPARKYPTVVYVYGGPHATNVKESWNYQARPWEYYMANRDYILFIIDGRGSGDRGFDFESCTHRHLGDVEMLDQMQGVNFLKTLPYVDADRIGVHGWSFGGFMTTNLMCTYPDVFKVGVAGGPVIDWRFYEVMYGERYMDTPQENPEGYASSSLLNKAKNLKGRLQVIVGYNDRTCLLQHSLAFLRACEDAGVQPDYFVYPGQDHNMMGQDMIHLHERITRYFDDYLKPAVK